MVNEILLEKVIRAMIEKINEALDNHVRKLVYEEVLDPRYGYVEAAKAAIEVVEKFYEGEQ